MKPYERHVFICLGDNCSGRGSTDQCADLLLAAVDKAVSEGQLRRGAIKATRTQCLGACGFGPNIAVYPEGVWYYEVKPEDIPEIVSEHLVGGRVVSRLLFHKYGETMPDEVVRDRVCGMVFHASEAAETLVHQGETYYFCGESCLAAFRKDPSAFLWKSQAHGVGTHGRH